jgi:hypothetical protein
VASLAQSIAQVILAPVIRHTEDIMHIHVLQDTLQKIRHPHYHMHPDFATGYTYGQSYYATHERPYAYCVGFVLGWLTAIIEHGKALVYPKIIHVL